MKTSHMPKDNLDRYFHDLLEWFLIPKARALGIPMTPTLLLDAWTRLRGLDRLEIEHIAGRPLPCDFKSFKRSFKSRSGMSFNRHESVSTSERKVPISRAFADLERDTRPVDPSVSNQEHVRDAEKRALESHHEALRWAAQAGAHLADKESAESERDAFRANRDAAVARANAAEAERDSALEKLAEMTERNENRAKEADARWSKKLCFAIGERDAALQQLAKARKDAMTEADIAAGSERAVETSPIADGGRYSIICEKLLWNQARRKKGPLSGDPAAFAAIALCGLDADTICTRLNYERDGRIAAEAELAALKAQHANGSEIPNGSGGDGEELYPVKQIGGLWYVRLTPKTSRLAGTEFAAYEFSKTLKELDAARLAAEKRAEEYKRERDAFSGANEHLNKANRELRERLLAEDTLGITVGKTDDRMSDAAFRDHAAISIAGVTLNWVKIGDRAAADSVAESSMNLAESLVAARARRDATQTSPSA